MLQQTLGLSLDVFCSNYWKCTFSLVSICQSKITIYYFNNAQILIYIGYMSRLQRSVEGFTFPFI